MQNPGFLENISLQNLRRFMSALFILFSSHHNLFAQDTWNIQRIHGDVVLDGPSNESAWNDIDPLPMVMYQPVYEGELTERTEIRIAYDDAYLYASGRFYDSDPAGVHVNSLYRDRSMNDDMFNLFLDTFNDKENALRFATNPAGNRVDNALSNDGNTINENWDTFWDVAAVQNEQGWFAEMRIPFSSLGFKRQSEEVTIGLIACRYIDRKNEIHMFPAFSQDWPLHTPSKAHEIHLTNILTQRPVYVTPYVLGGFGQNSILNADATGYSADTEYSREIGLDVKYNLTHNLTLDATINTDFAQIEADDEQVNLTRFSLYFPEKRRFFQERAGIFSFAVSGLYGRDRLFHSRRIGIHDGMAVRILGGLRLVGRAGPWDIGIVNMQTEKSNALPSENFGVMRLRRQVINENSYAGGMLTSRLGADGSSNVAYGFDSIIRLFNNEYLTLRWSQTFEDDLINENSYRFWDASSMLALWERRTRMGWNYEFSLVRSGEDFLPGIGYTTRRDFTEFAWRIHYDKYVTESSKLKKYSLFQILGSAAYRNVDGSLESAWAEYGTEFHWKSGAFIFADAEIWYEDLRNTLPFPEGTWIPAGSYVNPRFEGGFRTAPGRLLHTVLIFCAGAFYDGWIQFIWINPVWSISRHLNLSADYSVNFVRFPDRDQEFDAHIVQLRIEGAFNTKCSINGFIQYSSISDQLTPNIRFRYNFREGNDLWIVYNEGFNTDRDKWSPMLPKTNNRAVLMKYTHTFIK